MLRAVFEGIWDGRVPDTSESSGNPIVLAAKAQGKLEAKIDKRVSIGTGVTGPGAQHPGARHTTAMEEMSVEAAKHRSEGTSGKAQEHKRSKGALEVDLGGRPRLPKPRSMGCIDEKVGLELWRQLVHR